ncbi:hypothetical protein SDC9_62364 [bioreactor metagenome]|uniref:Flagellar protein FliT n=1 Tax=bioreactor metagenome TaxID=1076179 RepID=A0A644XIF1_9ZZZZ
MAGCDQAAAELRPLMEEALTRCLSLRQFSEASIRIFTEGSDEDILEFLAQRDAIIADLAALESRFDTMLEDLGEKRDLPQDVARLRGKVRAVLAEVGELDLRAMELLRTRMQEYKDATLKARSREHISAYIESGHGTSLGGQYNQSR